MHENLAPGFDLRLRELKNIIGNTPLLAIHCRYRGEHRVVYAKAEHMNLTGSIKDRMAFHILERAHHTGSLRKDDIIAEATSGNTGISFAAIGRSLGHQVVIFMPDWMSRERVDLIRSLGARIVPVSHDDGGFLGSIEMTKTFAEKNSNIFLPSQFSNEWNVAAHEQTTGPEIWWQLKFISKTPDAFVAGIGTGGTIMGVGKFLRKQNPNIRIFPLQPAESPTLSAGHKVGQHRIQGISDEFVPPIVDLHSLDQIIDVHDGDAILTAQKLASQLGLAVGISSGANFIASLKAQDIIGHDAVVVTVFPDDNKKYLSTDLLREEPVRKNYFAPDIEFLNYEVFKRVCHTCCDSFDCTQRISCDEDLQ